MEVWNKRSGTLLASKVEVASTFWARLRGWMGRSAFPQGTSLLIQPCNSIHTWFMKAPIDAVFLNKELQVLHMIYGLEPYKISPIVRGATAVLEFPAGSLKQSGTEHHDLLIFQR